MHTETLRIHTSRPHSARSGMCKALAAACSAAMLVALTSCGSSSVATSGGSSATGSTATIVLYSSMGYDQAVADAFTKKTGYKVQLVRDSTGPLLTKISAEKNNPQWTMLWAGGDTSFSAVDQMGLFQPYQANATFNDIGKELVPSNHAWQPAGVTLAMAALCNSDKVPDQPQNWSDLSDPKYKGLIGMNDPATSGPAYPFVAGMMDQLGGVDQGKAYFSSLKANGLQVSTSGDTVHPLETGQIGCALIPSSGAIIEQNKQKGKMNLTISYPNKTTIMASAMGISKAATGSTLTAAQKFEDFFLSPEGQQIAQAGTSSDALFWPIVSGVNPPTGLPSFPTDSTQHIDPAKWGSQQADIVTWFTQNIK